MIQHIVAEITKLERIFTGMKTFSPIELELRVVKCQIKSTGAIMGCKLYFLIKELSRTFMMITVFSYIAELDVNSLTMLWIKLLSSHSSEKIQKTKT